MPERKILERAAKDARQGKAPATQAGEFIHEEIKHVRRSKHGAAGTKSSASTLARTRFLRIPSSSWHRTCGNSDV